MKVPKPNNSIKAVLDNQKFLVKIIKIKANSTLISINKKELEIPQVLDKNKIYFAIIKKDGTINISFKKEVFDSSINNNEQKKINQIFETIFIKQNDENISNELFYNLNLLLQNIPVNEDYKKSKNNYIFKSKDSRDFYFFFNTCLYNQLAKIFITITKKNVYLDILTSKDIPYKIFTKELKKVLSNKINAIIINFTFNNDDFYNIISKHLKKSDIDIKI